MVSIHTFVLEHYGRIGFQVAHVDLRTEFLHVRMLFAKQPTHMREEKATTRVVWVSVCIAKLVMHSKRMEL